MTTNVKLTAMTEPKNARVVLGFGPQSADFFSQATELCGNDAVIDPDVARMAGATFAIGKKEHLAVLRKRLEAGALQAEKAEHDGKLSDNAIRWLANGERGVSSNTIFTHLTGIDALYGWDPSHPHDPDDLYRCRLLLQQVPELRARLHEMATCSPVWARLVAHWDELCELMDAEAPDWPKRGSRAPKTYRRMRELIDGES